MWNPFRRHPNPRDLDEETREKLAKKDSKFVQKAKALRARHHMALHHLKEATKFLPNGYETNYHIKELKKELNKELAELVSKSLED